MTSDERVFSTLHDATGLPGTKFAWPLGDVPALPWFVYLVEPKGEVFADNDNYFNMPHYRVELYLKENDPELVKAFTEAIDTLGTYRHRVTWIEGENCLMHSYTFTLTEEGA